MAIEAAGDDAREDKEDGDVVIAAICENKAREVGLAVFETGTAVLHLQQYVENSFTYSISL